MRTQPRGERRVASGRAARERAARAAGVAQPEEFVERRLCPDVAAQPGRERQRRRLVGPSRRPRDRIQDAVDDERPDLLREQVRVGHAEIRAVRHARVGELAVADGGAQPVHVAGHVRGRHVVGDPSAAAVAGAHQVAVRGDPLLDLVRGQREGERGEGRIPLLGVAEATQRGAARDSAWIEADEIEAGAHLGRVEEGPGEHRVIDARAARPARVQKERPDPMHGVSGRQAHDRQRDRRPARPRIIKRHLQRAALELPVALAPADLRPGRPRGCGAGEEPRADHGNDDSQTNAPHTGHRRSSHRGLGNSLTTSRRCQPWRVLLEQRPRRSITRSSTSACTDRRTFRVLPLPTASSAPGFAASDQRPLEAWMRSSRPTPARRGPWGTTERKVPVRPARLSWAGAGRVPVGRGSDGVLPLRW
jgi:hypothetical protein